MARPAARRGMAGLLGRGIREVNRLARAPFRHGAARGGVPVRIAAGPAAGHQFSRELGAPGQAEVEAVGVHHLGPRGDEVAHELLLRVVAGVDLGERPQLRVASRRRGRRGCRSSSARRSCGRGPRTCPRRRRVAFHSVPMSSRLTKKSLVSVPGRSVKTPCGEPPALAPRTRRPPTRTVISGAVSVSSCALSTSSCLGGTARPACEVVAEAVGDRLEHGERLDVGLLLRWRRCGRA